MLIWNKSEAGTIRDSNQERWHLEEDLGLLIMADGDGPAGSDLADLAIASLGRGARRLGARSTRLAGISTDSRISRAEAPATPLSEILESTWQEIELARVSMAGGGASCLHLAVAWIRQGCLYAATLGKAGLIASVGNTIHRLEPAGLPSLAVAAGVSDAPPSHRTAAQTPVMVPVYLNPIPVTVGDWVMMVSQGLLISQPLAEIIPVTQLVHDDPERLTEGLFMKASARYDGDDRTIVLARFLPSDITRTIMADAVISTDFDRKYRVPLWIPLVVSALLAVLAAVIGRFTGRGDE
ncbi:hypothetical protein KBA41_01405 [Candidatus Ozemobacteraceae bacterium]|nr:hypothetical protein [Candidatus Ozemobacteraceae bacterium]